MAALESVSWLAHRAGLGAHPFCMKICLFHPKLLPPRDYGGVERVVGWLAKGLAERGHEVWVGALQGSRLPAGVRLLPFTVDKSAAWDLARACPPGMDVVHWMAPPEKGVSEKLPCPALLTVHGNGRPGEEFSAEHGVFEPGSCAPPRGRSLCL